MRSTDLDRLQSPKNTWDKCLESAIASLILVIAVTAFCEPSRDHCLVPPSPAALFLEFTEFTNIQSLA
jgi:hypothetical protein